MRPNLLVITDPLVSSHNKQWILKIIFLTRETETEFMETNYKMRKLFLL